MDVYLPTGGGGVFFGGCSAALCSGIGSHHWPLSTVHSMEWQQFNFTADEEALGVRRGLGLGVKVEGAWL